MVINTNSNKREGIIMIISASRRTDIPAFYSEWLFNRIKEGFVYVINPMNPKQVSKVRLHPDTVDCFVFWTKNAGPMIKRLDELKDYKYYFEFTITGYDKDIEEGILDKREVIDSFKALSDKIGRNRVIFRYDPILLSEKYTIQYHCRAFEKLCKELKEYSSKCVISFIDLYKKTERNMKKLELLPMTNEIMEEIAEKFSKIASEYHLEIETCAEKIDLSKYGIKKGKCIDDKLISEVLGCKIDVKKDDTQREVCGCVKSIDIGQYNTCRHHCLYCYANFNDVQVEENFLSYDKDSPTLIGGIRADAKITERKMKSIKIEESECEQMKLNI